MASFGTLALLLAFGLLAGPDGAYGFDAIRAARAARRRRRCVLALMLLGAGSKAGLVPLHVWLPLAHPAAPSHVSALMSGVMTKVAIYGFMRVVFDLLGPPPWWASPVVHRCSAPCTRGARHPATPWSSPTSSGCSPTRTIENVGIIFAGARPRAGLPRRRHGRRGGAGADGGAVPCASTTGCSRACCSWAPARC